MPTHGLLRSHCLAVETGAHLNCKVLAKDPKAPEAHHTDIWKFFEKLQFLFGTIEEDQHAALYFKQVPRPYSAIYGIW